MYGYLACHETKGWVSVRKFTGKVFYLRDAGRTCRGCRLRRNGVLNINSVWRVRDDLGFCWDLEEREKGMNKVAKSIDAVDGHAIYVGGC